ncbi:ribonuclease P protein component [Tenacibaculum finnmarkense]|uniref:Ribonuclease P protein component n=1 Tax=Tenacibaculum finnmarkense genomovar finnmarkense TaxID=1458503 RepID=A0AAP1RCZ3_9FLAO|nr:ribonuclease P protein component [Tenacibaculum finnmarkense]MBE7651812.1 ribonuclease P protein component [Tenacibaculum finnmarkense genomovar finnmarkense]MBE7693838.1 ribonuclease P protein component [Tenacibaculum finnmarkense genomovar finnmarkense]MCD8428131.1 ribonuclease P protein component [Tenacibaculum finnmarkense genomovar finnmarkense]MCG8731885.1 ribonuclease P protein component [Tenacibaculum finnmarkense]MCG8752374.1 ribonuclease P protein component [Tenacibaculum finnmark
MKFTLGQQERLKSKKLIGKLYEEGKSVKVFPLRMVYIQTEHTSKFPVQVGVSVPKRNFKSAVDRNRIKRLLRETYRKEKYTVYDAVNKPHVFMISYIARDEWTYADLEVKMKKLLTLFVAETHKNEE